MGWPGAAVVYQDNTQPSTVGTKFSNFFTFFLYLFRLGHLGVFQKYMEFRNYLVASITWTEHTYLARRSTVIMKAVPLGRGPSIAHRLG